MRRERGSYREKIKEVKGKEERIFKQEYKRKRNEKRRKGENENDKNDSEGK